MALLLAWVSLGVCMLLLAACVALYVDARGARETLATWKSTTEARLENYAARLATIEGGSPSPRPAAAVARSAVGASPSEPKSAPRPVTVELVALFDGGAERRGDSRSTLLGVAPPAVVLVQGNMRRGERVMSRFYDLAARNKVAHCNGEACEPAGGVCACPCTTCASLRTLMAQAERETATAG